jgi:hypothetical protein
MSQHKYLTIFLIYGPEEEKKTPKILRPWAVGLLALAQGRPCSSRFATVSIYLRYLAKNAQGLATLHN